MEKEMAENVTRLTTPLVDQAIALGELGLKVIPAVGKRCPMKQWQHRCSSEEPEIRAMFDEHPDATNVAVVCGQSGLFVIDLDRNKEGESGPDGLDWQAEHSGDLPATRVHRTPSGGYHLIYRMPEGMKLPNISIANKVDSRGMSGYIIWPTENSGYTVYRDRKTKVLGSKFALTLQQRASEISQLTMRELETNIITDASGFALHDLINQMIYRHAKAGVDAATLIEHMQEVVNKSRARETRPSEWADRYDDINRSVMGAVKRLADNERKKETNDEAFAEALKEAGVEAPEWIEQTAEPEVVVPVTGLFEDIDLGNLLSVPMSATPWVMHGVLERGAVTGLAGWSNVGKTRWMVSCGLAMVTGLPLVGFRVSLPGGVLLISHEERKQKLQKRILGTAKHWGIDKMDHPFRVSGAEKSSPLMLLKQAENSRAPEIVRAVVDEIVAQCKEIGAAVVMLDPLVSFSLGVSENDAAMHQLMRALRMVAEEADVAVLFLHHTPKGNRNDAPDWYMGSLEGFRGSGAIGAALDIGFTISRIGKTYNKNHIQGLSPMEQRRWLRFEQAKGRETLLENNAVYYLESVDIDVQTPDGVQPESQGVIDVRSLADLETERMRNAEDTVRQLNVKQLIGRAGEILLMDEEEIRVVDLRNKMHELDSSYSASRKVGGRAMSLFYALFPVIHNGWIYEMHGTGRYRKIIRVEADSDD